jgi:nicotinamide-nucleotide amidase
VLGQTVDTNSAWLSHQLASVGCDILAHQTVSDDQAAIQRAIGELAPRCDYLIVTGGLGPTEDDLTRPALAGVLGVDCVLNELWLARLEEFFRQRKRPMAANNRAQALIPRGADMIDNTCGTAPGLHARLGPCDIYVMPGVPREMTTMFTRDILPHIAAKSNGAVILSRTLHTFGMGESTIGAMLGDLMTRGRNPSVGTTVSGDVVSIRINARFPTLSQAQEQLADTERACREVLGELVYAWDGQTLQRVVFGLLKTQGKTVTAAESCTGGLLCAMLTETPGSSASFNQGWVTYANSAKQSLLGVPEELLTTLGAVSEPVVLAMAQAARQRGGADYALAISGIAGPEGGTIDKPVGTVCIALADASGAAARTFSFPGDRDAIRDRACKTALALLRLKLLALPVPF